MRRRGLKPRLQWIGEIEMSGTPMEQLQNPTNTDLQPTFNASDNVVQETQNRGACRL